MFRFHKHLKYLQVRNMVHSLMVAFYGTLQGTFVRTANSCNHQGVREVPRTLSRSLCTNSSHVTLYRLRKPIYLVLYHPG